MDAAETCYLFKSILVEILKCQIKDIKIECLIDNQSLKDAIYSTKNLTDKRLKVELAVIKDMVTNGEIEEVIWKNSASQLVDCLTKGGASTTNLIRSLKTGYMEI